MAEPDRHGSSGDEPLVTGLDAGEAERLTYGLETRFADHLEAAAVVVRQAERELADAQARLARAQEQEAHTPYQSDPLVFMRESVSEEVEALARKSTEKKIRASYRFLLDRAVELAAAEVQGFRDDQTAAQRERDDGVEACRVAEERATETLEAARAMQERVRSAERCARQGLATLVEKLTASDRPSGST
jgi:hypothetical protein